MTVLLQISDPHFGTERGEVVDALKVLTEQQRPDLIVVSGDITQRARQSQFEAAGAFLESLDVDHLLSIPGNHDIPLFNLAARLFWPYHGYRRVFGKELEPGLDLPNLSVIGVDGTRRWRHVNGELSRVQRRRIARRLASLPTDAWRVVVTHQPVSVPGDAETKNLMRGHDRAVGQWIDAGADLFLGGHIHLPYLHRMQSDSGRSAWCLQAGTALSTRTRGPEPNSVNLVSTPVRGDPELCLIERWDFREAAKRFRLRSSWVIPADRSGAVRGKASRRGAA